MPPEMYKIGRKAAPTNDYVVADPSVSGAHATLRPIGVTTFLLEDVGSMNGTFVQGARVARAVLTRADSFRVGNVEVRMVDVVGPLPQPPPLPPLDPAIAVAQAFAELKAVWTGHDAFGKRMRRNNVIQNVVLTAAGAAVGGILVPGLGMLLGGAVGRMGDLVLNRNEALMAEQSEFTARYVCPHPRCRVFLGHIAWDTLRARNKCLRCNQPWMP